MKTRYSPRRNRAKGFTLLEVMVAVVVLAIGLVAILKANVLSMDSLITSRERTTAFLLLASKLAEVEAAGPANWNEFRGDFGEDYPGFSWQVETEPTLTDKLTEVVVIVAWDSGGEGNEIKVQQLLFEP